jgi:glucosylceramidase
MKSDATTLTAYALYLSRAIQEFKKSGINIEYITCQNEPDQKDHNYPTCGWSYDLERTFYKTYMIPRFQQDNLTTKILLGVYCCTSYADGITSFMNDQTIKSWVGVTSHSWQDPSYGQKATTDYPTIPFFETEADWGQNAVHDWNEGVNQFNSMVNYLTTGKSSVFTQWSMVMDQRYSTNWSFAQSGPININTNTHVVTYEPHYWAIKHIEHYVMVGAKAIAITTIGTNPGLKAAFLNPNGDIIVVVYNAAASAFPAMIKVVDKMYQAILPANSFTTIRIGTTTAVESRKHLESNDLAALSNVSIRNSTLHFSFPAGVHAQEADLTLTDPQGQTVWAGHCTGSVLRNKQQAFAIRSGHTTLCSGIYLLAARIKNESGAVTTIEKKVSSVN